MDLNLSKPNPRQSSKAMWKHGLSVAHHSGYETVPEQALKIYFPRFFVLGGPAYQIQGDRNPLGVESYTENMFWGVTKLLKFAGDV